MNSKTVSTKINAIFLATLIITGIIAVISLLFITASTQTQPYSGRDNRYNSYEPGYERDNDRKSYGKDSYESQYPSHKPDYKLQHPSYGKDNNIYKSRDAGIIGLRAPPVIEICFDRIDNDGDGLRDFTDPDCPPL